MTTRIKPSPVVALEPFFIAGKPTITYADAQHNLAICYRNGNGVPQDRKADVAWMRKAAEQRYAPAQLQLSLLYYHGEHVPRDDALSIAWITKAAEQGYVRAQSALGYRYAKAARQGYEGAQEALDRLQSGD